MSPLSVFYCIFILKIYLTFSLTPLGKKEDEDELEDENRVLGMTEADLKEKPRGQMRKIQRG